MWAKLSYSMEMLSNTMDAQSIFLAVALMTLANGVVLATQQGDLHEDIRPAVKRWQTATLLIAIGCGLFAFGKRLPVPVLVTVANGTLIVGLTFYQWAIQRFYGEKPSPAEAAISLVLIAIVYLFSAIIPNFTIRLSLIAAFWTVILVRSILTLHRHRRQDPSRARRMLLVIYGMLLGIVIARAGLYIDANLPEVFTVASEDTAINLVSPVIMALLPVIGTTVFSLMCVERMKRHLQVAATTDYLTGLSNRRVLVDHGEALHVRASEGKGIYAALVFDVDHFKRINDTHGHAVGDSVLVHVSQRLRSLARSQDTVVRCGGEEFIILADGLTAGNAIASAERIRAAIAGDLCIVGSLQLQVTVSAGVALYQQGDSDFGDLLRRADRALYHAKAEGRDRVKAAA